MDRKEIVKQLAVETTHVTEAMLLRQEKKINHLLTTVDQKTDFGKNTENTTVYTDTEWYSDQIQMKKILEKVYKTEVLSVIHTGDDGCSYLAVVFGLSYPNKITDLENQLRELRIYN